MASSAKIAKESEAQEEKLMEAIQKIDEVQSKIDELNEKASEEILKVEQKYNKMRQPHYEQRSELIAQIPKFWLTCFINHPQISALVTEEDEQILQHLTKITVQEFEDIKSGYKISMYFSKNLYFQNEVLTKEFNLSEGGEPSFKSVTIDWYPGKNPCEKGASKEGPGMNGDTGRKRQHSEGEMDGSFFSWFSETEGSLDAELGEIIKDDLWPNPLQYYLNQDMEEEEEDDGSGEEELDGEGEDEEEDA
jgi:template-activating factor I